jgi:hypothetical protein
VGALSRRDQEWQSWAISQPVPQWLEPIKAEVAVTDPDLKALFQSMEDGEAIGPWAHKKGLTF